MLATTDSRVTADDVAAYILQNVGSISTMKLHKLLYYCQAWSLVWDEDILFPDEIQAWANGPVVPNIFREHKGQYRVCNWPKGRPERIKPEQIDTIRAVLQAYGDKTSQWLSDLTHREAPWLEARKSQNLAPGERGRAVISPSSLLEYYSGLQ